ncbi:MAG: hypothetical protein HY689_05825 [Chloroflexi bacterium]|nr:hypothetical protein [Chloroflexota bacterium]
MRRSGGAWFIRYDGVEDTIPHLVGLGYLAVLLRNPMHTFRPEELVSLAGAEIAETVTGSEASAAGLRTWHEAEGPVLDEEAVKQIQQRIAVLQSKRSWGTLNSSELAELQALQRHLRSAMGLGKQPRRMTSEHGKLRASVAKAISYARNKIGEHNPVLALFLEHAVKTRGGFTYEPDRPISWLP